MDEIDQKTLPYWTVPKLEVNNKKLRFSSYLRYEISETKDFKYFAISRDRKRIYVSFVK